MILRVVVVADNVHRRTCRIDRCRFVLVVVDDVPVEVEISTVHHFSRSVRVDELEALPFTKEVHVRLEPG